MCEARNRAIRPFDYEYKYRRVEHEEATKKPEPCNSSGEFCPKGAEQDSPGNQEA
jgi:hypothetical protein